MQEPAVPQALRYFGREDDGVPLDPGSGIHRQWLRCELVSTVALLSYLRDFIDFEL
ncbi:hypothetical protein SBA4_2010029 [Candidatus Sulfopaludibacter sp. SbA4]|nr:hypothetical protein SBA4_2010029 [Candidatus Sulfopaludibacter sp. SbA4]